MMYMNSLSPVQLILGIVAVLLIGGIIYIEHNTTGIIDSLTKKVEELITSKLESDKHVDKLNLYVDSVEVKANQVSQFADSVKIVSDETIEENNRLKIQLTKKESLIKKYKFENKELIDHNQINNLLLGNNVDSINTLREEVNKRDFIIQDLKQDKDSLIQQINNYKVQTDAVNQLIKDKKNNSVLVDVIKSVTKGKPIIITHNENIKLSKSKSR